MPSALPNYNDVVAAANRVSSVVQKTPILTSTALDDMAGAQLFIKAECLQTTGSFKVRGAYNRLAQLTDAERKNGVVAYSSGNHAQGVSRAARRLSIPALIVMPSDAPKVKIEGVLADGAEIKFYHRQSESREEIAADIAADRGAVIVPSFDDPDIIAGQGTVGLEISEQVEPQLDHLVCCTGGGGLISGIALALSVRAPATKIWTAEPEHHDDWRRSLEAGKIVSNRPGTHSICDAILTPQPGEITWAIGKAYLAGGFAVSDDDVKHAMRAVYEHLGGLIVEPGGAAALAAALRGLPNEMRAKRVGIVATGSNVDADVHAACLGNSLRSHPPE